VWVLLVGAEGEEKLDGGNDKHNMEVSVAQTNG